MKRNPGELTDREFDVVVVGGGIFGVALAWEAASRGLSTAIVERGDFCEATSANSFKMVHGGIRYLQHGDLYRIRESCAERSSLLRIAPHLVRPLPIVVPTYRGLMKGRAAMRAALSIYDLMTLDRNRGIRDPINHIPPGRIISRDECLAEFPLLNPNGLTGGALFYDGQMYNPTRLALCFLRSAVEAGARAANYVEATGFLRKGNRVVGVRAVDRLNGDPLEIRGRSVITALGAWTTGLLARLQGAVPSRKPTFSRDACFVVPRRLTGSRALAVQGATSDPDALLSRGARHLFLVPWRDHTLVGVWHIVHEGDPDEVTVSKRDLQSWIDEINGALPGLDLSLDDAALWNAGLVLFGENRPGATDLSYGKRSWILDHRTEHGLEGLISVIGVRYTTARGVAERTLKLAAGQSGFDLPPSRTEWVPLHGGDFDSFDDLRREADAGGRLGDGCVVPLLRNYGSRYGDVLRHAGPGPAATIAGSTTLEAEVLHAVREEMAVKLSDVVLRRTDLGTGNHPGDEALARCAQLMAGELGWDTATVAREIETIAPRFLRAVPSSR